MSRFSSAQGYRYTILLHRLLRCGEQTDNLQPVLAVGKRPTAGTNAVDEMLALYFERLDEIYFGNHEIAGTLDQLKLAEGVEFAQTGGEILAGDALVEDLHFVIGMNVVIDDHFLGADDGHLPHLAGVEPTEVQVG